MLNNNNTTKSEPDLALDEYKISMDEAIESLWRTGYIDFKGARAVLKRATLVREMRTRIVEKAIRAFIKKAKNDGWINEDREEILLNVLLGSSLEDFI